MKILLRILGIVSALVSSVFVLICIILLPTTPIIEYHNGNNWITVSGGLFGGGTQIIGIDGGRISSDADSTLASTGLAGWLLMFPSLFFSAGLIILSAFAWIFSKRIETNKAVKTVFTILIFAMSVGAFLMLLVGGVLVLFSFPVFWQANSGGGNTDHWHLGVGWIFAGILAILAGCLAILPATVNLIVSKKK